MIIDSSIADSLTLIRPPKSETSSTLPEGTSAVGTRPLDELSHKDYSRYDIKSPELYDVIPTKWLPVALQNDSHLWDMPTTRRCADEALPNLISACVWPSTCGNVKPGKEKYSHHQARYFALREHFRLHLYFPWHRRTNYCSAEGLRQSHPPILRGTRQHCPSGRTAARHESDPQETHCCQGATQRGRVTVLSE